MRIARYLAVVVLGALLTACGASGWQRYVQIVVTEAPLPQGVAGQSDATETGWSVVVKDILPDDLAVVVMAHELGHCILATHSGAPQCLMYEHLRGDQSLEACLPGEVDWVSRRLTVAEVYAPEAPTRVLVEAACKMWNDYAGREVFVVLPARAD